MATHTFHPDTHTHGLADDCPRCKEHAENPSATLDAVNLANLRRRIGLGLPGRSVNERLAMVNLFAREF